MKFLQFRSLHYKSQKGAPRHMFGHQAAEGGEPESFGLPPQVHVPAVVVLRVRGAQGEANAGAIAPSICLGKFHVPNGSKRFQRSTRRLVMSVMYIPCVSMCLDNL